ncbi:hypothetical protein D3C79_717820 [compost metagenome]
MTDHVHRDRLFRVEHQLRTFRQPLVRVDRFETDQLLTVFTHAIFAIHPAPTDPRERLGAPYTPAHVQVVRGHRAVGVLTDDDEALLGPQDVHGFGAVRGEVVLFARLGNFLQHAHGVVGLDIDLVRQLTGERDTEHPCRYPGDQAFLPGHERECILVQVDIGHFAEQLAAVRA